MNSVRIVSSIWASTSFLTGSALRMRITTSVESSSGNSLKTRAA